MKISKAVSVILREELLILQSAIYTVTRCRVRSAMKAWHRRLRQRYAGEHPNCKVESQWTGYKLYLTSKMIAARGERRLLEPIIVGLICF
jgi:hypothetical protein